MKSHISKIDSTTSYFYIGIIILTIPYIFWLLIGENSYVLIHDNLDHEFVFIKLLLESDNLFGFDLNGQIELTMNGIDRSLFRSGINLTFLFFYILPPIYAYITNHFVVHIIGYIGMFVLVKKYFVKKNDLLTLLISLTFAFLSYYHIQYGISISGQPLLLYAFMNLLNNDRKIHNWIILVLFPFFSFLVVTLPFFFPFLIIIGIWKYYSVKQIPLLFIYGIILISVLNIVVEYNLIYSTLFNDTLSHRTEWVEDKTRAFSIVEIIKEIIKNLLYTQYHSGKLYTAPVIIAILLSVKYKIKITREIKLLSSLLIFIIIWSAINSSLITLLGDKITFLKIFQTSRFYFLSPFIWTLLFAIVLNQYNWASKRQRVTIWFLIVAMLSGTIINNKEVISNLKILMNFENNKPTFRQFYDQEMFNEIKQHLGYDEIEKQSFLCVGIFPNIAQYNGLKTLDSYQNNYPLEYKHEFRKIISAEINKNIDLLKYFDNWGSRCYAFSSELGKQYLHSKYSYKSIENLNFNFNQIKKMKGKYILSAIPIQNFSDQNYKFIKSFTSDNSYWKLYLYEIY